MRTSCGTSAHRGKSEARWPGPVRDSYHSVPARYAGHRPEVRLGANTIRMLEAGKVVAAHTLSLDKGSEDLVLGHYLEALGRKAGVRWPVPQHWLLPARTTRSPVRRARKPLRSVPYP